MTQSGRSAITQLRQKFMQDFDPNQNSDERKVAVHPEFAALVFGLPGLIIFLVTAVGPATPLEYLAGFAWSGSLFALAIRGFRNEEKDAFAPIRSRNADLMPVLLAIFGAVALLESERVPGVFLLGLAVAWTFAAPTWRPLWSSKPVKFVGGMFEILQAIMLIGFLAYLIWSWISK